MFHLLQKWIPNGQNTSDPAVRQSYGKCCGWMGILANLILFCAKITIGFFSGSVSIQADAVNNLSDAGSALISLMGFKLSSKPADKEHPYGHGRYEYLSGLLVCMLIFVIGFSLLKSSIDKIIHPTVVTFSWISVGILCGSVAMKLFLMLTNHSVGKAIDSQTLIATAQDSRNDVISTLAVLAALLISHFTSVQLDGIIGLLVALFILYSGVGLLKDTLYPLLGAAPDPALVKEIRKEIMSFPGVLGTHDLMIHDYGPGRTFASVHVEMAAEDDPLISHDVIDNIEQHFHTTRNLHLVVHYDPIVTADGAVSDLRYRLAEEVTKIDPALTIHDLRIVPGVTHTNVVFDCLLPPSFPIPESELRQKLQELLRHIDPTYCGVVTFDRDFVGIHHEEE